MSFGSDKLQPLADRHSHTCRAYLPCDAASHAASAPMALSPCIRCGHRTRDCYAAHLFHRSSIGTCMMDITQMWTADDIKGTHLENPKVSPFTWT
jgi:hypothetical protein